MLAKLEEIVQEHRDPSIKQSIYRPSCAWYLLVLVMTVCTPTPPPTQSRLQAADLLGCYDLLLGDLYASSRLGMAGERIGIADTIYSAPPPRIQLDTVPGNELGGDDHGYAVSAAPGALPSRMPYAYWSLTGPDEIKLVWNNGFVASSLALKGTRELLRGRANHSTHQGWLAVSGATATRVACDAPIADSLSDRFRYPRGVELANGDSIRLREPLTAAATAYVEASTRSDGAAQQTESAVVGIFAGAQKLGVRMDHEGLVTHITFELPVSDPESIVSRLARDFGPPQVRETPESIRIVEWKQRGLMNFGVAYRAQNTRWWCQVSIRWLDDGRRWLGRAR